MTIIGSLETDIKHSYNIVDKIHYEVETSLNALQHNFICAWGYKFSKSFSSWNKKWLKKKNNYIKSIYQVNKVTKKDKNNLIRIKMKK